jgi:hypothetical protein
MLRFDNVLMKIMGKKCSTTVNMASFMSDLCKVTENFLDI